MGACRTDEKKGDSPLLCDDQRFASVPASGPFRQKGAVPFFPAQGRMVQPAADFHGSEGGFAARVMLDAL
jgi:hypothetical protein